MHPLNSVKLPFQARQVLWIAGAWLLMGALDAVFVHAITDNPFIQRTETYRFFPFLVANSLGFACSGLFAGSLLIFFLEHKFRDKSFAVYLFANTAIILLLAITMNLIVYHLYYASLLGKPPFDQAVRQPSFDIFLSPFNFKTLAFGLLLTFVTVVAIQINDKYGPGVFGKLLTGKYHHPREEERIFMFLDMKSSTTIAEQIGHIRFHQLLHDFFRDITDPILHRRGEIYQYVGDEAVISWQMKHGLKEANCIDCFFDMQEAITLRAGEYLQHYGLVPEFKAGLHCGAVTIGEIGVVKKDIVFSGDVLNTTARIQSRCNEFGAKILLSENLVERLVAPSLPYELRQIGEIALRRKTEEMIVYTFDEINPEMP